mmetsp:Transcript_29951/g.41397  ORF Transcript_29951/g.41397 Transcript_29951/m.41397 type:complete len:144 (+) Transcript_29951:67-498(+)
MADVQMRGDEQRKFKGRGSRSAGEDAMDDGKSYDRLGQDRASDAPTPQKSIEGWVVFVSGVHEEAQEDDIHDKFADFGEIRNLHMPLDRRTGYVKGYCMVEYETRGQAKSAIDEANESEFMGKTISVDWSFAAGPSRKGQKRR